MMTTTTMRTYTELSKLLTFEERFKYLKLSAEVGAETFGSERYLNQKFYRSLEWKRIRDRVIMRDMGCDLGLKGFEIHGPIYIHHMNPFTLKDLHDDPETLLDPEYLVCVKRATHNAIHYGDETILLTNVVVERKPNDTCPWRK